MSRLVRISLAGALVAVTLVGAPAGAAKPDRVDEHPKSPVAVKIVTMGDSYSSGNGAGDYIEQQCSRSRNSYGAQVAERLGAQHHNVACGGGVTHDLLEPRALGGPRPRTATYLVRRGTHADKLAQWRQLAIDRQLCGVPAQDDFSYLYDVTAFVALGRLATGTVSCQLMAEPQINAVDPSTDLVFVTTGGNDVGFSDIAVSCIIARLAGACRTTIESARAKAIRMQDDLKAAALAVHERTHGNADIYLLGYPFLINTDDYSVPEFAPTYNYGAELHEFQLFGDQLMADGVADLNARTSGSSFHFVDVKPTWDQHTHGMDPRSVADQSQSWIVAPFAAGAELFEWVHPNLDGWTATARALYEAVTG